MSDLISRQAAIDAMSVINDSICEQQAIDALCKLPSAHPDLDEWCTDCKEYDHERHCCPRYNRVIREAVEEAKQSEIIRCKDCKWWDKSDDSPYGYCMAAKHGYMSAHWEIGIYRRYKGDFYCADAEMDDAEETWIDQ